MAQLEYRPFSRLSPFLNKQQILMTLDIIRVNDIVTIMKWPEKESVQGRVTSVLNGTPANWKGVYYEALNGNYTGRRLFAFRQEILENLSINKDVPPPMERIGINAQGFEEYLNETDGTIMVKIPAGRFIMGSDFGQDFAAPQRSVHLNEFFIDKLPITVAEYRIFCNATDHKEPKWKEVARMSPTDEHPMVGISYEDAQVYCEWSHKRLPSEAEWEKAARGTGGIMFPWGDEPAEDKIPNIIDLAGKLEPKQVPDDISSYGVRTLVTGPSNLCSDFFSPHYYKEAVNENPQGPESGERHSVRGSGWSASANITDQFIKERRKVREKAREEDVEEVRKEKLGREQDRRIRGFTDGMRLFVRSSVPLKFTSEFGGFRCARTLP